MPFPKDRRGLELEVHRCEVLLQETVHPRDVAVFRKRGIAVWELGENLFRLGRHEESAERLEEAVSVLRDVPSLGWLVVHALIRRSNALSALGRNQESLDILDRAIELGDTAPHVPDMIPLAMGLRMFLLEMLGREDDAYGAAKSLIDEVEPGETQKQKSLVASALVVQGTVELARGRHGQALAIFDEALVRCSNGQEGTDFEGPLAEAMLGKALVLEEAGRTQEAIDTYDKAFRQLAYASDPAAREAIAKARKRRASLVAHTGRRGLRRRLHR